MKKTIFKKFYLDALKAFFITSFTLVSIIWILQAVNFLDFVSEDGHSLLTYFKYSFYNIPKIFVKTYLLAFFISFYYLLIIYENNNQLLIFWSNGILKTIFLKNVLIFVIFLYLVFIFFSFFLAPFSQNKARFLIKKSNLEFFPSLIKEKKFIDTVEDFTIFLESKNQNQLKNILIKDSSNPNNIQIIISQNGSLLNNDNQKILTLNNGKIINTNLDKKNTILNFETTNINLNQYSTKSVTDVKVQELSSLIIIECIFNLYKNSNFDSEEINCKKNFLDKLNQEMYERLFVPMYLFIISIIVTYLILKPHNNINYNMWKYKIFLFSVIVIILSELSVNVVGDNLNKNLAVLLFLPLIFVFLYFLFLKKSSSST